MLVFDIESSCTENKPNPLTDRFKFLGAYDFDTKEYFFIEDKEEAKELLKKHKILIGFNSKGYDEPILKRERMWSIGHVHIDLYEVIKKRKAYLDLKLDSYSLMNIAKGLKLKSLKIEQFDYSLLNKEIITEDELQIIKEYTLRDIDVTKELFEYIYDFFKMLEEYMSPYDQKTLKWMTSSIAAYAYKVICFQAGLDEEYDDAAVKEHYVGAYVLEPTIKEAHGNIICYDFSGLYPNIYFGCNLFSHSCNCCSEQEKWSGNGFFELNGKYCSKKLGAVESVIKRFFELRKIYKENKDKRQYALKIIQNAIYGASASPLFKSIYGRNIAPDCISIARKCIKTAIEMFNTAGFEVIYGDTDSCYVLTEDNEGADKMAKAIGLKLSSFMPFPNEHFELKIDANIKHIWFSNKNDKNLKKQYIYVTTDDKVKVVGLPLIKSDGSTIGYKIFKKYMEEDVKNGRIKFDYELIKGWIENELEGNMDSAARKFRVKNIENYKNKSQLQYQISEKYGEGLHVLMQNKVYGVGIGSKYCTIDEFREHNLGIKDLDLNKFWSEMKFFCDNFPTKIKNRRTLELWCDV